MLNNRTRWRLARRQAHAALLWYPEYKKEYADLVEDAMAKDPERHGTSGKPLKPDPTADAAIRLASDIHVDNLRRKITAVETAMMYLSPLELEFVRRRYWDAHKGEARKARGYDFLEQSIGYERWTLIHINQKILRLVAIFLGEY